MYETGYTISGTTYTREQAKDLQAKKWTERTAREQEHIIALNRVKKWASLFEEGETVLFRLRNKRGVSQGTFTSRDLPLISALADRRGYTIEQITNRKET